MAKGPHSRGPFLVLGVIAPSCQSLGGKYARLVAPPFTWTGLYVGGTAGYANGNHSSDDLAGAFLRYPDLTNGQSHGFAGGGTLGVNLRSGRFVYGLEADISWLTNKTSFVDPNGAL